MILLLSSQISFKPSNWSAAVASAFNPTWVILVFPRLRNYRFLNWLAASARAFNPSSAIWLPHKLSPFRYNNLLAAAASALTPKCVILVLPRSRNYRFLNFSAALANSFNPSSVMKLESIEIFLIFFNLPATSASAFNPSSVILVLQRRIYWRLGNFSSSSWTLARVFKASLVISLYESEKRLSLGKFTFFWTNNLINYFSFKDDNYYLSSFFGFLLPFNSSKTYFAFNLFSDNRCNIFSTKSLKVSSLICFNNSSDGKPDEAKPKGPSPLNKSEILLPKSNSIKTTPSDQMSDEKPCPLLFKTYGGA